MSPVNVGKCVLFFILYSFSLIVSCKRNLDQQDDHYPLDSLEEFGSPAGFLELYQYDQITGQQTRAPSSNNKVFFFVYCFNKYASIYDSWKIRKALSMPGAYFVASLEPAGTELSIAVLNDD